MQRFMVQHSVGVELFIFAYKDTSAYGKRMSNADAVDIITKTGLMARAFPVRDTIKLKTTSLPKDIVETSDNFAFLFDNAGYMHSGTIYTTPVNEIEEEPILLGEILESGVDESFYITDDKRMAKWIYLKGAKKIQRKAANGHEYTFSEGPIAFPDPWDRPGRTMLTSESTLNRSTHVVTDPGTGKLRTLTPVEAERLQGFDDNWTNTGMPQRMRFFCMGNALVVPMITRMGEVLDSIIEQES